jgi:hypothetical protein
VADPNAGLGGSSGTAGTGTGGDMMLQFPDPSGKAGRGSTDTNVGGGATHGGSETPSVGSPGAKGCGCSFPASGGSARATLALLLLGAWSLRRRLVRKVSTCGPPSLGND